MHDWQNFIYFEPHAEDIYLYEEKELRLMNFKAFGGKLGFHPHAGVSPFFIDWSFEHQFNSSLRSLSETIGKLILLM